MRKLALFVVALLVVLAGPVTILAYGGPGLYELRLFDAASGDKGLVKVYNSPTALHVKIVPDGWLIAEVQIYAGQDPVPTKKGKPDTSKFPFKTEYAEPSQQHDEVIQLDQVDFSWGVQGERIQNLAVHVDLVKLDSGTEAVVGDAGWALGPYTIGEVDNAWWFTYELAHPKRGHFIDAPVAGLTFSTPTSSGLTDASGAFDFFPGESVSLSIGKFPIGSTLAAHKISPLDLFEMADTDAVEVINMARLLQSLDSDAYPKNGIDITPAVVAAFEAAMAELALDHLDFGNSEQIADIIYASIDQGNQAGLALTAVTADAAKEHLEQTLSAVNFRKNNSKTPVMSSAKAKLNVMGVWFPARTANGEETEIEYFDEDGNPIRTASEAKPLVITYTDQNEVTGAPETWAAVSRDDGATWKRKNLSRSGDRSSFTLSNGEVFYGETKKPVMQVKGNKILVAWTSKFCNGGKPRYAIDLEDDYSYDDPYYSDDIWGVAGPQRSHDYSEDGFPEVGELPYSCVWTARGIVATDKDVSNGLGSVVGDIVWYKPERLTSGRRDALQIFMGGADGAGMAIAWQEDPDGLRPGKFAGPGHGWSGATTNHKTDIWYSYIPWGGFAKVDANFVAGGDPEHEDADILGRPKALVPMSLPVRLSDNDVVNTDNLTVELGADGLPTVDAEGDWTALPNADALSDEGDGTHRYGYEIDGLCGDFYDFVNEQGEIKRVCITADGRLLDGDTGASRPNLFLQTYTKPDGTKSAWAIMNYEETKGAGSGSPDDSGTAEQPEDGDGLGGDAYVIEEGKNVIYHSFDFQNPELVSAGHILNHPARDADDNILYLTDDTGAPVLDYLGNQQLAYENARRARFILQGKKAIGASGTIMNIVYKEGQEGSGRPSDIMLRRVVVPALDKGNPYRYDNIVCDEEMTGPDGKQVCIAGAQNMSSVTPTVETSSEGDPEVDDPYGAIKVVAWKQTEANFSDASFANPYEDARAHRGQLRGDFVVMGYSYTPNWAAARNGNDKYDFFVRRSFDGGQTWTTDPSASDPIEHCQLFKQTTSQDGEIVFERDTDENIVKEEVCTEYGPGAFEQARNVSQLANAKVSVIEPRIVATPGTIKVDGVWTGIAEDKQNQNVFYLAFGLSDNPKKDPVTGEQADAVPLDLLYSFTQDKGQTYVLDSWVVNPDSDGNNAGEEVTRWGYLAKGASEQGEVQLRMTPDGSRFYSSWLQEIEPVDPANPGHYEGSDIWFRRIMSNKFQANVGTQTTTE